MEPPCTAPYFIFCCLKSWNISLYWCKNSNLYTSLYFHIIVLKRRNERSEGDWKQAASFLNSSEKFSQRYWLGSSHFTRRIIYSAKANKNILDDLLMHKSANMPAMAGQGSRQGNMCRLLECPGPGGQWLSGQRPEQKYSFSFHKHCMYAIQCKYKRNVTTSSVKVKWCCSALCCYTKNWPFGPIR